MLEELKQHVKKLKEKQEKTDLANKDLEAHNKAAMAWLTAALVLPENSQMHVFELLLLAINKVESDRNTPPPV